MIQRLLFKALRRYVVAPLVRWYLTQETLDQLEGLDALGAGVEVRGPIRLLPGRTRFGRDVSVNPGLVCTGEGRLVVGDHVHFGKDIRIITANHNFERPECLPYDKVRLAQDVVIGDCTWICDGVLIVPGVTIGEGAVLAAGAVVTHDVPPLAVVGGAPARVIRYRDEPAYRRLKEEGRFLGWPKEFDLICGRRVRVKRPQGRPAGSGEPTP
jgi:acetyltransferase-like isoleucine patch superfamily enzyme